MTKKTKQDGLSMLNRHHSQKTDRDQHSTINSLSLKKCSNHKKSIKKPSVQLQLIDKVELLKEKSHKFYKHAQKKIDRMIQIMDEIDEKHLLQWVNKSGNRNGLKVQEEPIKSEDVKSQAIKLEEQQNVVVTSIKAQLTQSPTFKSEQRDLIAKTLTQLHNLLTYERPLSHIKNEFESFYSRLSSFAKQLQPQLPLPNDKRFLIPQNGLSFEELRNVQQLIKQHYLRMGYFDVAEIFDHYGQEVHSDNSNNLIKSNDKIEVQSPPKQQPKNHTNSSEQFQKFQNIMKLSNKQKPKKKTLKKKPKVQLIDLQQNFKQCSTLRHQLLTGNFTQAINWCAQQRLYETHQNPLEYNLQMTEIKLLIHDKKYRVVFEKIEKDMVKFLENYEDEINMLIGYLLFSCEWNASKIFQEESQEMCEVSQQEHQMFQNIINSRYQKFLTSTIDLPALASTFTHEYFIHFDISQFDTLQICYQVAKMYQSQYFDSIKMFSQKDREEFLKHRGHCDLDDKNYGVPHAVVLPFEIPVNKEHLYHSIFVCPVTKEVLSSNDGVEFLSCGHLVSESAKKNMAEVRRSNHKQKCPVCQKDRASEVMKVRF